MAAERLIQVCGDPTVDWLTVHNAESDFVTSGGTYFFAPEQPVARVELSAQPGGCALVRQFLDAIIPSSCARIDGGMVNEHALLDPQDRSITRTWTKWRAYAEPGQKKLYFRLEEWLDFDARAEEFGATPLTGYPDLLVIADDGQGFAGQADQEHARRNWPQCLGEGAQRDWPGHVVLKWSQYGDGRQTPLVQRLLELGLGPRTTVVTAINDLRACAVRVGAPLSWERMLEEVVAAVRSPDACPFMRHGDGTAELAFARVIVTLGASGAVILEPSGDTLIFDRSAQEGDYARQYRDRGQMLGYNVCVLGALARAWADAGSEPDWTAATWAGVGLARTLLRDGYELYTTPRGARIRFPSEYLAKVYSERPQPKDGRLPPQAGGSPWDLSTFVDRRGRARDPHARGHWSILEDTVSVTEGACGDATPSREAVLKCARAVALAGPQSALPQVPVELVGRWRSADRHEIEGVRSVYNAMSNYLPDKAQGTPLSVAVFGPPGSGKSFAIKEIARSLGIPKEAHLTFNLSQFRSPDELAPAFHQVRDLNLKGQMPLVFWDEFDSRCGDEDLGWLRYFLAPMQDGEFSDQGRTHPLGRAIFCFAGATRHSFDEFCRSNGAADVTAKKPDFTSRLRAYVNVRGPNGYPNTLEDRLYLVRRAFLFNTFLEMGAQNAKKSGRFVVDANVLSAFLCVSRYQHGARSMETLVRMSNLAGKRKFELSSLPPDQILRMHVDAASFASLALAPYHEPLRVGVTGHIALDAEHLDELHAGIQQALALLAARYPGRPWVVLSSLASGADRLVTRAMLSDASASLIAVLPLSHKDYARDFGLTDDHSQDYAGADLRQEFDYWLAQRASEVLQVPPTATRVDAYALAGRLVIEHCDVLVAVWDGQPAQGVGGSAEIVALAKACGKPTVHIAAANFKVEPAKRTCVLQHGALRHINLPGDPPGVWTDAATVDTSH